jgi:hypothetical protein
MLRPMKQKINNVTDDELIPSAPTLANTMLAEVIIWSVLCRHTSLYLV